MKDSNMELQKPSKTSLLKLMILRAWRERWNVALWGINIKRVLPRGVSGDAYNLADCILQQSLVGTNANPLVLNYLKHCLCANLVSHAAVLRRISKYDFDRVYCITTLLQFLEDMLDGVTCRNKPEEGILPSAVASLIYWITHIVAMVMKNYEIGSEISAEQSYMFERTCVIVEKFTSNQFLMGIFYIGCYDDIETYGKIRDKYNTLKTILGSSHLPPRYHSIVQYLQQLAYLDATKLPMPRLHSKGVESISYCVQPLLAVEVLLNPCNDTSYFVAELQMIQRLKNYSLTRLIYEIVRAGFISLSNVVEVSRDTLWGAFTFFKVPHIIKQLHALQRPNEEQTPSDHIPEVVEAFELLLEDNLLLDLMDTKCSCNIIEYLLNDWTKQHLVTDVHVKHFATQRESTSLMLQKRESGNQALSIINFIIRAEVPLSGVLKTLSTDYNKVQEALLGVLCQVLVGNSFDLILSVATVEGRLKTFVTRLIQCNENSKQVPGEIGKPSIIRSTLFDVSFLMLTFIVQTYGSDVVLSEHGDSFFEKWVRECMAERNKPKNPRNMIALCDEQIVDELLLSLRNPEAQHKNSNLTWQDICLNLPGVLNHVLIAWEKDILTSTDVKSILENIKRRMFAFSVCATSFLCAYMYSVRENELLKPLNMIQQFLTPLSSEEMASQENVKERLGLSFQIIRKMQQDVHPSSNTKSRSITLTQNLVSQTPLSDQFREVWKTVTEHGWLPVMSAQVLESLLQSGGPIWLTRHLVQEILNCKYSKDMLKTLDIVFAVLHLDIDRNTEALLKDVIPSYAHLMVGGEINEPQSHVLALLSVYCIISALEHRQGAISSLQNKRTRTLSDADCSSGDLDINTSKIRKLNQEGGSDNSCSNDFLSDNHPLLAGAGVVNTDATGTTITRESARPTTLKEPLHSSIQHIFKVLHKIVSTDELTPKVYFAYRFISLLVECGGERVRPVLKLLPPQLIQNLLKIMVTEDISVGLICRLYDLRTTTGRQSAVSDLCVWRNIHLKENSVKL
ncbi:mediator of RNA polymerase II transcription subunit 24 [Anastrepha obliqua]|uniref:mediator of RNA polymerase II transcription subunit 24 n=1 Tax=Anastrepha obliqua TaxID=95512 RepID=UPI002409983C|nr:mediator of RNA polymerase II transcription subunit 24 [Anastrepha obliqua]